MKLSTAMDECTNERTQHTETRLQLQQMKAHCEQQKAKLIHQETSVKLMKIESNAIS